MANKWFHPQTLLDKTYEIGLFVKAFDGLVELIGGIAVLLIPRGTIEHWSQRIASHELYEGHSFIAHHVTHASHELTHGSHWFVALFLLTHGIVKVGMVIALLRQKHWAYPWALGLLTAFLIYQIYLLFAKPGIMMALLTVIDMFIIWLVWREWQVVKQKTIKAS